MHEQLEFEQDGLQCLWQMGNLSPWMSCDVTRAGKGLQLDG